MASPERTLPDPAPGAAVRLSWTVHPAAARKRQALLVGALVVLAGLLAASVADSALIGLLGSAWLAFVLRAFFLPRTYVLDATGASEDGPLQAERRIAWQQVRRVLPDRHGLFLSERLTDSRLLPARGLYLRTGGNAQQVAAWIEAHR